MLRVPCALRLFHSFRSLFLLAFVSLVVLPLHAFEPSPTSPYTFSGTDYCSQCEVFSHTRVGDGNWHAPGCGQSGSPLYYCGCSIGYQPGEMMQPPILRVSGNTIELEYYARNAYCNPPADGGSIYEPLSIPFEIDVFAVNPTTLASTLVHVVPPYWEHGKISFTGSPSCTLYRAVYLIKDLNGNAVYFNSSNMVGATGSSAGLSCLNDLNPSCAIGGSPGNGGPPSYPAGGMSPSSGRPINVGSGNMQYSERLFSVDEPAGALDFTITYNSRDATVGPLGLGFIHPFAQTMTSPTGGTRLWRLPWGGRVLLAHEIHPVSGGDIYRPVWPSDSVGTMTFNGSTYTFRDLAGTQTVLQNTASGTYTPGSVTDRWGNQFVMTYTGSNLTGITDPVGRAWSLAYTGSLLTSITDGDGNQWRFTYDASSRLQAIFDPLHTGSTPWRQFTWVAYATGKFALAAVADESGAVLEGHQYDSSGRAISSWIGDTSGGSLPAPGPNARELVTLAYTDDTHRTVTTHIDTNVDETTVYTLTAGSGRFLATSIQGACTSCGTSVEAQAFTYDDSNRPITRTVGLDRTGSGGTDERVTSAYTYDANGQVLTATEAVGTAIEHTTTYAYAYAPWRTFVTSMTRSSVAKPGQQSVTTFAWNTSGAFESQLTTTKSGYLSSTDSSPTVYTTTTLFDGRHRPLEVDGPGSGQKSTRSYYADNDTTLNRRGRLSSAATFTSAQASLAVTFDNYDVYGTARKQTDPNAVDTVRTLDARGRAVTSTSVHPAGDPNEPADYVTSWTYDGRDRLVATALPRGNGSRFEYESGSNLLTGTVRVDSSGNEHERLLVTLTPLGAKAAEAAQDCISPANPCSAWTTRRSDSFAYDAAARLATVTHPDATTVVYGYDSRGNVTAVKDERHAAANTLSAYDARNRIIEARQKQTIVPGSDVVTAYGYDDAGNLTSVTDPNGNATTYVYDDFGRVQKETSPVTGLTTYGYDAAGNVATMVDANGATTTRTYDAASRILTSTSTRGTDTEQLTWTYDDATAGGYGIGRLATMASDDSAHAYSYDRRGLLREEDLSIEGDPYVQAYGYDADGNRNSITYPSGRVANYVIDFAGRAVSAAGTFGGVTTPYVSTAGYAPFGPLTSLSFANGATETRTFDQRYFPASAQLTVTAGAIASYTYAVDGAGNITAITDLTSTDYNRAFAYDDLNRLVTANSGAALWGTGAFSYDAMGNMLGSALGSRTRSFTYAGTTPLIDTATDQGSPTSMQYDAAGNELNGPIAGLVVADARTYSPRNLLRQIDISNRRCQGVQYIERCTLWATNVTTLWNGFDARGVRVFSTRSTSLPPYIFDSAAYFYTPELRPLATLSLSSPEEVDTIWFAGRPIALDFAGGSAPELTFTDHLGTPLLEMDVDANVVWQAEYEPFGNITAMRAGFANEQSLRFPGQQVAFTNGAGDEENYNIFRWYRSGWGRYTQADPAWNPKRTQELNPYSYAAANPVRVTDSLGLRAELRCRAVGAGGGLSWGDVAGFFGFKHCYLVVSCDGPNGIPPTIISYLGNRTGVQVASNFLSFGMAGSRNADVQNARVGTYDSYPVVEETSCCKTERCILGVAQEMDQQGYSLGSEYSAFWGPNSNSVAHRLIYQCRGNMPQPTGATGWW